MRKLYEAFQIQHVLTHMHLESSKNYFLTLLLRSCSLSRVK